MRRKQKSGLAKVELAAIEPASCRIGLLLRAIMHIGARRNDERACLRLPKRVTSFDRAMNVAHPGSDAIETTGSFAGTVIRRSHDPSSAAVAGTYKSGAGLRKPVHLSVFRIVSITFGVLACL
jgi:hypothetical protein